MSPITDDTQINNRPINRGPSSYFIGGLDVQRHFLNCQRKNQIKRLTFQYSQSTYSIIYKNNVEQNGSCLCYQA